MTLPLNLTINISVMFVKQNVDQVHSVWIADRSATVRMIGNVTASTAVVLITFVSLVGEETIVALVIL